MNLSPTFLLKRAIRDARSFAQGRPKCLKLARSVVFGKQGIEIGGPSEIFRKRYSLPLYGAVSTLDNCDFSQETIWASHENTYCFHPKKPCGRTFITEGATSVEFLITRMIFSCLRITSNTSRIL